MAKRIKDGLFIKGKEGENHKELNWSTLKIVEQPPGLSASCLALPNSNPRRNWA